MTHAKWPLQYESRIYAAFIAVVFILLNGYAFNTGDQAEHLPQVYRMLNPSLYPHDFFLTLYDQTFTVREYYVWLVYSASLLLGVEWACFVLYFCCFYFTILAWFFITKHLTDSTRAAFVAPILIFLVFHHFTIGGNTLSGNIFTSSLPAEALASWGMYYWLNNRKYIASILVGASCLFQALLGLQVFVILSVLHLSTQPSKDGFLKYGLYALVFFSFASPMLIPMFYAQSLHRVAAPEQHLFYETLFYQRAPWHYVPSLFPKTDYLTFFTLLVLALIGFRWMKANARKRELKVFLVTITLGCIAYYLFFEAMGIMTIGKLQWFKTTVWLNAFCCIILSSVTDKMSLPKYVQQVLQKKTGMMVPCILLGLFAITESAMIPVNRLKNRYHIGNYPVSDLQKLHEWIKDHTATEAIFLTPPDDESFACEAQRSTPVNYKALVHEPFYFKQWRESITRYYGVNFKSKANILQQAKDHFEMFPQDSSWEIDYIEVELPRLKYKPEEVLILHREGAWGVMKVKK